MEENKIHTEAQISYLQMIQGVIDRMSTTSAIFKGFCAAIITGISAVSFTEINRWVLLLAVSPVICFFILDIYYLMLEKRYRALYNSVRTGQHAIDFDLSLAETKGNKRASASIWMCLKSPSIFLFYTPAIIIAAAVITFKFLGVI